MNKQAEALLKTGKDDRARGGGDINDLIKLGASLKLRLDPRWTLTFPPFRLREQDILLAGDDGQALRGLGLAGRVLDTPGRCVDHIRLKL